MKEQINKHKYCMAKDDIVMGLGRPMFGASVHNNKKKAYPSVITTLGQMMPQVLLSCLCVFMAPT